MVIYIKKLKIYKQKKKNFIKKEKTFSNFNVKTYKYNYNNNCHNLIYKKIYYNKPIEFRNISTIMYLIQKNKYCL